MEIERREREMEIERIGMPGGTSYPYMVTEANERQTIVYAPTFKEAVDIFQRHRFREPYSVRQMSDNE